MLKVLKFGGTSVASIEKIRAVAEIVKKHKKDSDVVVVVSAMAGFTNKMVNYTNYFTNPSAISKSLVHSCGEQITSGLLTAALNEIDINATPMLGWQVPIVTTENPFNSWIKKIETKNIENILKSNAVPIVAGFQGITEQGYISTLGRGGSDTTAVALGVALNADLCYIYTDVEGVYNKDPNACKDSVMFKEINHEKMVEMSKSGAKVVHARAALMADSNNLDVIVLSTFNNKNKGTLITENSSTELCCKNLEGSQVKSVVDSDAFTLIEIQGVENINETLEGVFNALNEEHISVDMLNYSCCGDSYNIKFVVEKESINSALLLLNKSKSFLKYKNIKYNSSVKKISVIGHCLVSSCDILGFMFSVLNSSMLNAKLVWASEFRVSMLLDNKDAELLLREIYNRYEVEG